LTNTDWREAQFDDQSCVRSEVGSNADCSVSSPLKQGSSPPMPPLGQPTPPPQSNAGVEGIHFTAGNPFWVRGGIAVYF
jgi:hypothetical protein